MTELPVITLSRGQAVSVGQPGIESVEWMPATK